MAAVVLSGGCSGGSVDRAVDLNTVGARPTPGVPVETTVVSPGSVTTSTAAPVTAPRNAAVASAAGPSTSSVTTAPDVEPCVAVEGATATVGRGGESWWVQADTTDDQSVRSAAFDLESGREPEVVSLVDLDGDGSVEILVLDGGAPLSGMRVLTLFDCSLVEPVDTLSGRSLELFVGVEDERAAGVACDGSELVVTSLERITVVDGDGLDQVRFQGEAFSLGLFSALWERSPVVAVTLEEPAVQDLTQLDCPARG